MKHWVKANTDISSTQAPESEASPDVSIDRLLDQGLVALSREMKNLLMLSVNGKLDPADARDLRDHLKLLFELKERENDLLKGLTDEQLADKLKAEPDENI